MSYNNSIGDPPPYKYSYTGDSYREQYPSDYYPHITGRIKLNPTPDQYKIGYRDGFNDGYKLAMESLK